MTPTTQPTRFLELLDEMAATHKRKSKDYGSKADRLKNLRASERLGVPAALGTAVRMGDKVARIEELMNRRYSTGEGPAVTDESLTDTLKDLAVYSLLLIELLEDEQRDNPGPDTIEFTDTTPVPSGPRTPNYPGPNDLAAMLRDTPLEGYASLMRELADKYNVPVELAYVVLDKGRSLHQHVTPAAIIEQVYRSLAAQYRTEIDRGDVARIMQCYMPQPDRGPASMREAYEYALDLDARCNPKRVPPFATMSAHEAAELWDGPS